MGQYHYLVNITKRQFVHPHQIGNGLKLREQVGWPCSTSTVLAMLVAASNGRGGGDFHSSSPLVGSWAGDKIAFIGDYSTSNDIKGFNAAKIYENCCSGKAGYKNISAQVRVMMADEFDIHYKGDAYDWLDIVEGSAPVETKKGWVEENPLVEFDYPDSKNYCMPKRREVRVIEANEDYIIGLDTLDNNRFKKFKRNRIFQWRSRPLWAFKSGKVSEKYEYNQFY